MTSFQSVAAKYPNAVCIMLLRAPKAGLADYYLVAETEEIEDFTYRLFTVFVWHGKISEDSSGHYSEFPREAIEQFLTAYRRVA